ncbi:MAG TPA: glycosyltransferase family 4 protein [Candidatus Woesebacteria bacterium]|nr:glycosyltransferase family 4 protein [Candidatus Woesebacteria bacterium]
MLNRFDLAGFRKDVLLVFLLRLFRIKIIYHIHNKGIIYEKKNWINKSLYNFVFKNQYAILLSENLYYDIEAYVPRDMVFYCPNGIKDYQPTTELLSLPEIRPFNILFFSNLIKDKGVFVLIDACSKLRDRGIHFHCDFVGGEADVSKDQFNKYVEQKGLTEQVKYLGKRYGKLKEMTFEQADVFALPSRYDCFPLVILEAMQHRLPVITANEGGMPDMVEDGYNGYVLQQYDDVKTLTDRLEHLFHNSQLRMQLGNNGRIKYENNFTLEIFEERLLSILQKVLNKKEKIC